VRRAPSPIPWQGGCAITLPAVELAVKQATLPSRPDPAEARRVSSEWSSSELREEDASRYCPLCSQKLESRRCKLICNRCGYCISCADYIGTPQLRFSLPLTRVGKVLL
jgi:hypothetical protein